MAFRNDRQYDPDLNGELEISEVHPNFVEVYFFPPQYSLNRAGLGAFQPKQYRRKLLSLNSQDRYLTIHPIWTLGDHQDFLKPKYGRIERITLLDTSHAFPSWVGVKIPTAPEEVVDILDGLPETFTKDYGYGLGLNRAYRHIIDAVANCTSCKEIVISRQHATGFDPDPKADIFYLSAADFDQARRAIKSIDSLANSASRTVKGAHIHNILADRLGLEKIDPRSGKHPYRKLFTAASQGKELISDEDQSAIIGALSNHVGEIAAGQPQKLAKLRGDIELVTLELLIERYESMLGQRLDEGRWQELFNENPFILSMAFGYPIIKVQGQASVGGRKLSGDGGKITDFLVKNSLTNNTALFEIKRPDADLLKTKEYRGGVYAASTDLSGSINQLLDQKYQLQKQIAQIKDNSRIYDLESYAVHCCLIIGHTPDTEDQKKSFEFVRRNSRDVEITTFDELLEKLKLLKTFLQMDRQSAP